MVQNGAIDFDKYRFKEEHPRAMHPSELMVQASEMVYVYNTYHKYLTQYGRQDMYRDIDFLFRILGEKNPLK